MTAKIVILLTAYQILDLLPKVVLVSYEVESNEYQSGVVKQGPEVALLSILSCRL